MRVHGLGHVVLKVRNLERSVPFYTEVLGLKEVGRLGDRMVFFSFEDNHHDVALLRTTDDAPDAPDQAPGLAHVALKVGDSLAELREAKAWLERNGVEIRRLREHKVSQSIYFADPDGNELEFFVDADPRIWRENPALVATGEPLTL